MIKTLKRVFCRRAAALSLSAVAFMPFMASNCDYQPDITLIGSTHVNLYCTGTGVSWSAVTIDFLPYEKIIYKWEVTYNGIIWANQSTPYYTDGGGDHFRLPNNFPQTLDCGHGVYTIRIWTVSVDSPTIQTAPDVESVTC